MEFLLFLVIVVIAGAFVATKMGGNAKPKPKERKPEWVIDDKPKTKPSQTSSSSEDEEDTEDETPEKKEREPAKLYPKYVLTKNEQPMYFRLVQSLPEHIVLAQVSFSALVNTWSKIERNTFNRKMADFVICNKSFEVVAIIELDDSSHDGREEEDNKRDDILKRAGHNVLRYRYVPDIDKVKSDIKSLPPVPYKKK